MKFYELIALIKNILEEEKNVKKGHPSLRFVIIAYNNVLAKIYDTYSDNEAVTTKKLEDLELTNYMTDKLISLSEIKLTKRQSEEMKQNRKDNKLKQALLDLLGIGAKKADELIDAGLKTIKQLEQQKYLDMLNLDTRLDIIHKPEHGIKYEVIKELEPQLTNFKYRARKTFIKPVLTGSFLRKKPTINDIDILFLAYTDKDIDDYLAYLSSIYKIWIYANGKNKISLIFNANETSKIFNVNKTKYKADIFIADKSNYYSMLLYTTGSKNFNIRMRAKARKMGLLLNQNGIFKNGKKINNDSDDEKTLFKILDMDYVSPEKRF